MEYCVRLCVHNFICVSVQAPPGIWSSLAYIRATRVLDFLTYVLQVVTCVVVLAVSQMLSAVRIYISTAER